VDRAQRLKEEWKDGFVSVEHLVLGIAKDLQFGEKIFGSFGLTYDKILKAIQEIRGTGTVMDQVSPARWSRMKGGRQDPEGKYEALSKYSRDLTAAARDGKLDPVIGRDDEIRRCIQILSRRTKNNPVLIGEPGKLPQEVRRRAVATRGGKDGSGGGIGSEDSGRRRAVCSARSDANGAGHRGLDSWS